MRSEVLGRQTFTSGSSFRGFAFGSFSLNVAQRPLTWTCPATEKVAMEQLEPVLAKVRQNRTNERLWFDATESETDWTKDIEAQNKMSLKMCFVSEEHLLPTRANSRLKLHVRRVPRPLLGKCLEAAGPSLGNGSMSLSETSSRWLTPRWHWFFFVEMLLFSRTDSRVELHVLCVSRPLLGKRVNTADPNLGNGSASLSWNPSRCYKDM